MTEQSELVASSAEVKRAKALEGMRRMIEVLEAHPELEIPYSYTGLNTHVYNIEQVQQWIKALPGKKAKAFEDATFSVETDMGIGGYEVARYGYYIPIDEELSGWAGDEHPTTEEIANRQEVTYEQKNTLEELDRAYGLWGVVRYETRPYFTVRVQASREAVCEKKVVGTKLEKVTKYTGSSYETLEEVDVVEWECNPSILAK